MVITNLSLEELSELQTADVNADSDASTDALHRTVTADWLRFFTLHLSVIGPSAASRPVNVLSLLHAVRQHLPSDWHDVEFFGSLDDPLSISDGYKKWTRTLLLSVLQDLGALGEVVQRTGSNLWLPTPLRLVRLQDDILMLGCVPTPQLKRMLPSATVRLLGYGRFVRESDLPVPVLEGDFWQDFDDWAGSAPEDLHGWAQTTFARLRKESGQSSQEIGDYEVLVCSRELQRKLGARQLWHQAQNVRGLEVGDLRLCRTRRPTKYFLGGFRSGALSWEAPLTSRHDYGWLALYFCLVDGMQTVGSWKDSRVQLYVPPVAPLIKLLLAYGHAIDGSRRRYTLSSKGRDAVNAWLGRFGARIGGA